MTKEISMKINMFHLEQAIAEYLMSRRLVDGEIIGVDLDLAVDEDGLVEVDLIKGE